MKYDASEALEDLWKLDDQLRGINQQKERDAWVRIHDFLATILERDRHNEPSH